MDITKNYVNMCRRSAEIQAMWSHSRRNSGDWYFHKELNAAYVVTEQEQKDEDCVWLPRQDQLQQLVFRKQAASLKVWSHEIYAFLNDIPEIENESILSFEEAWLRYVMYEHYKKLWMGNRKGWVQKS